jgi:hypothetical protein
MAPAHAVFRQGDEGMTSGFFIAVIGQPVIGLRHGLANFEVMEA